MIGMFVGLAVMLAFITVVGLGVLYFFQRDKKEFNFTSIFSAYFYLVAMISLLAVFFGLSSLTKAFASDVFGRDFSYYSYFETFQVDHSPAVGELNDLKQAVEEADQIEAEKERIESMYKEDLFNGISTFVVGLIFLIVHVYGWMKLEASKKRQESLLYKGYVILQLAVFSIISLAALPVGISQTLRYFLDDANNNGSINPGETISLAIWALPIWLFFIWLTIKTMRHENRA